MCARLSGQDSTVLTLSRVNARRKKRAALDSAARDAEGEGQTITTGEKQMKQLPWQITKIINVANELQCTGQTAASTGERIAAAFVLNQLDYLPDMYRDAVEAWQRLDDWQYHVITIRLNYMHLIKTKTE